MNISTLLSLCVALGIGLLIGAERERRKGSGPDRAAAGIRTFTVAALLGAVCMLLGDLLLLSVATLVVGAFTAIAYQRSRQDDPGITTEIALLLTCLLGGLAIAQPALAAGIGVALAVLLAARGQLHHFVNRILTERELHDALIFAAAALIALPLAPDRALGPFDAINPRTIATLVVLVMGISAAGYIATRLLGTRFGLPLAGFASGFASSTATIFAMGARAKEQPAQAAGAIAGAVLSTVATIVQMVVVIASVRPALLTPLAKPLLCSGAAALLYSLWFIARGSRAFVDTHGGDLGRAFDLKVALGFAALVAAVQLLAATLNAWLGERGMLLSAAVTGLVDAHATAASAAALVNAEKLTSAAAISPILIGLTTNAMMKIVAAVNGGGRAYALRIVPGLLLVSGALWLGALFA